MYEIAVERSFWAAHAVTIDATPEPTHRHNWRVRVVFEGRELDDDGVVCDFHALERSIEGVIGGLDDRTLNGLPCFEGLGPTAERVARHIADRVEVPAAVSVVCVEVTESPGCVATYRPDRTSQPSRSRG